MNFEFTYSFAQKCDEQDPLAHYREQFIFPQHQGENVIYFTGNSLGLQPKKVKAIVDQELEDWGKFGVEGHFEARNPWYSYHEMFSEPLAQLVGAKPHEVVAMNGLTTNLHLLLATFYQPKGKRNKIICEAKAFPSDQYAVETHVKVRGFDPQEVIVEVEPDKGENLIEEEKIISTIKKYGDEVACVMIGGVNYYTGQVFDMAKITEAGHEVGARVGFDLAHGAGNIKLHLHDWKVDFAAWCSYKYLNSGPGGISGVYIHEKHASNPELPRFGGWWGHDKQIRFLMEPGFQPMKTAEAWQLSNAPVFAMAPHKASLDIFMEAGFDNLIKKRKQLTGYLAFVLDELSKQSSTVRFEIITPREEKRRGAQLSVYCHGKGKELFDELTKNGVVADWREPNVIRMAPVPLYNSFMDIYRFGDILKNSIQE